jgi:site-specific DNA-methyltransferase (adenine-specific)
MRDNSAKIIKGDCLFELEKIADDSIDLIYLDPPFFSQRRHKLSTRDGQKTYSFSDEWKDLDEYVAFLTARLEKCRRKLKETGSLFLHCDRSASHYLKVALDRIFGAENFQSEIIWSYKRWSNSKKGLLPGHQSIFFYSKTAAFKFNLIYEEYSPSTYVDQILQLRSKDKRNKSVYQKDSGGQVILAKAKKGVPLGDVWDIPYLNPKAKERVSYPTQKPVLLMEKIISLVTDKGDSVLDPFCGSGSTLVAASLLKRNGIGIDVSADAVALTLERLKSPVKTSSKLLEKGRDSYKNLNKEVQSAIHSVGAVAVQRNKGIDGLLTTDAGIVPIKVVIEGEKAELQAQLLNKSSLKNNYKKKALLTKIKISGAEKKSLERNYGVQVFDSVEALSKKFKIKSL